MSKMAAFFAGLGSGYLKADRQKTEDERLAKKDGQDTELFNARMDEIKQAKSDKQALRDAGAERTTMQGTAVTTGAGDKNLYSDPMQAANAAEDAKIEAEMRGQQPGMVNMQSATGITGKMATGHQITTDPVDLKAINGAEAKAGRFQSALEAQGKPMEAMQMGNAVMENKAKKMGLETAELDFANRKFNTDVLAGLDADPDWTKGAASLLTKTQLGRMAGMTVAPTVSADGKTVSFVGTGQDGTAQTLATLPNTPQGKLQFTQQLLKASPEMKVSWLVENAKTAKAEIDAAQKQDNWGKEYTLKEKEVNSKGELRVAQAEAAALRGSIAAGRASSSNVGQGVPMQDLYKRLEADFTTKDPMTDKSTKDVGAISTVRNLILRMPAAQAGDADGAYLQAMQIYQRAQAIGGGDPARTQQALTQILGGGAQEAGDRSQPAKEEAKKEGPPARPDAKPAYSPPSDSPAGKAAENREKAKAVSMEKTMQTKKAVTDAAAKAIEARDAEAAMSAQGMDGFNSLPSETKVQIRKLVFGR